MKASYPLPREPASGLIDSLFCPLRMQSLRSPAEWRNWQTQGI